MSTEGHQNKIADRLKAERIVKVETEDGHVFFTECCDEWFTLKLTPDEADAFADYIRRLAENARA